MAVCEVCGNNDPFVKYVYSAEGIARCPWHKYVDIIPYKIDERAEQAASTNSHLVETCSVPSINYKKVYTDLKDAYDTLNDELKGEDRVFANKIIELAYRIQFEFSLPDEQGVH